MDNITYRSATLEDLPTLLEFEQGIVLAERPFDVTLKPDPISYYDLKELILSKTVEVHVAAHNNVVIGSGYAKIMDSKPYHTHEQHVYLGFMYVHPNYRGQGVIQTITEALKTWAKTNGVYEARLDVYHDNAPAIRAYEKSGFIKNMVEMRMSLK
ncbi:GNAT family N-acetyltransferase [Lacinutrix sp. WUR7]|uniref:GNAT family N-acetyltransferase n=1 Tax=Lacinutrix sp. WUR7 TaxID=2653681 RepID=UPI00193CDBE2|nr:GNAT family N-acetyltransferase [Lacinutrix sp. WUR7]QRM89472.1 GNAT family N-acetyltransferase [Lacinutrix sp. WUR7]